MTDRRHRRGEGSITWHARAHAWMAQVRVNGRRISKYFPASKLPPPKPWKRDPWPIEADVWIRQTKTAAEEGRLAHAGRMTMGEHTAEWWEQRRPIVEARSKNSARTYTYALRRLEPLMGFRLDQLSTRDVQKWINDMVATGMAPHTLSQSRKILSQLCRAAVDWQRLPTNPVKGTEMPPVESVKETRAWSTDEARRFLGAARSDPLEAFWWCLLTTGMRQGEVRGLEWKRVNLTTNTLLVNTGLHENARDRGPTKTRKVLSLTIFSELARALGEQRDRQAAQRAAYGPRWPSSDWVFTRDDGRPLRGEYIRAKIREAGERAGLEPLRPHEQRHTTVTLMAELGIPLSTIGDIVGRSVVKTTLGYLHVSAPEVRRAQTALGRSIAGERITANVQLLTGRTDAQETHKHPA